MCDRPNFPQVPEVSDTGCPFGLLCLLDIRPMTQFRSDETAADPILSDMALSGC